MPSSDRRRNPARLRQAARWRRWWRFLQREHLHRLLGLILFLILCGALGLNCLEPDLTLGNALWWSLVTLTTVGYGDVSPTTFGGRLIAAGIMILGIGVLGMCSATIATVLVVKNLKEERGMGALTLTNHIILCVWNGRAHTILDELRTDPATPTTPIVLIAELEQKPVDDDLLFFI